MTSSRNVWFVSDHHLGHKKLLTFNDKHGCLIRPEFDDVEEMNNHILEMHNECVKPTDLVYMLGDILWDTPHSWETLKKMQGVKYLTPGNHDKIKELMPYFGDARLWYKLEAEGIKFVASHVPLAYGDMKRAPFNVHGHLHEKVVRTADHQEDPRYFSVCVEQLGYTPIHLEDLVSFLKLRIN